MQLLFLLLFLLLLFLFLFLLLLWLLIGAIAIAFFGALHVDARRSIRLCCCYCCTGFTFTGKLWRLGLAIVLEGGQKVGGCFFIWLPMLVKFPLLDHSLLSLGHGS